MPDRAAARKAAGAALNIPEGNKIIISLDGGGMRGIFTIQLLKKLEEIAGSPIYKWADMVAGTSTGAIIAGLIACRKPATEIEALYEKLVSRVFTKKGILSDRYLNPPAFDKKNYRNLLKSTVGDKTLAAINQESSLDVLFTSKDMAAGEETFFTCFNNNGTIKGTYKDVLLRGVLEATMSAPTYFLPFERFIDGGTTTYNNPALSALMEALFFDGRGKYKAHETTMFSFGTASRFLFIDPEKTANPAGPDIKFWLNYVMAESSKDASEMQINLLRSKPIDNFDFRRYQLSLDTDAIKKLPNVSLEHLPGIAADYLHQLTDEDLGHIDMADVTKFGLMKTIGAAVVQYICPPAEEAMAVNLRPSNWFRSDLVEQEHATRGQLVTAHGDINTIKRNLSDPAWIDAQPTA